MTANGNPLRSSHAVFVRSIFGITFSGSFSHIPGHYHVVIQPSAHYKIGGRTNAPIIEMATYKGGCALTTGIVKELSSLTAATFSPLKYGYNWNRINLYIYLVPLDDGIDRKHYSLNIKNRVDLKLYYTCDENNEKRDVFYAYLQSMHEISHVMADLKDAQNGKDSYGVSGDEVLAEGGPACVYEQLLAKGDPLRLTDALKENDYFNSSWETNSIPSSERHKWCANWMRTFASRRRK